MKWKLSEGKKVKAQAEAFSKGRQPQQAPKDKGLAFDWEGILVMQINGKEGRRELHWGWAMMASDWRHMATEKTELCQLAVIHR